jgi:hypothetical protein
MKRRPPALVEMFPPMWQLPFAPKSIGIINLTSKSRKIKHRAWKSNNCSKNKALDCKFFGSEKYINKFSLTLPSACTAVSYWLLLVY